MNTSRWMRGGAAVALLVAGASGPARAAPAAGPNIRTVAFSGDASNPTITIAGSRFNPAPAVTAKAYSRLSGSGDDYGTELYLVDASHNPSPFSAGYDNPRAGRHDYIGLTTVRYVDTQISYQFGTSYTRGYYPSKIFRLQAGDNFTVYVKGAHCSGTVSFPHRGQGSALVRCRQ